MNSALITNIIRAVVFVLLQGLVLQRIYLGGPSFNYFSVIVYPVVIMLMPMKTPRIALVFIGFLLGLTVDLFYGSLGVHASACLFIAFIRPLVLQLIETRGGYSVTAHPSPGEFGLIWFARYLAIMLAAYLLFYFSVEVFTFQMFGQILIKSLSSFLISFIAIFSYVLLFNPKE